MKYLLAIILPLATLCSTSFGAQATEITPMVGQRFGGSFQDNYTLSNFEVRDSKSYGVMIDIDTEPNKQIEIYLSHQATSLSASGPFTGNPLFDLSIDYFHIGGLYMIPQSEAISPFVSGSIGLTRMSPDRPDLITENRLSLSLGGGAKIFLAQNLGLRFDARAIYTFVNSDTEVFCSGGCFIRVNSNGFIQTEIGASLMMRF